jgi:hypothetical protein
MDHTAPNGCSCEYGNKPSGGEFLTIQTNSEFSRKALLHGVRWLKRTILKIMKNELAMRSDVIYFNPYEGIEENND